MSALSSTGYSTAVALTLFIKNFTRLKKKEPVLFQSCISAIRISRLIICPGWYEITCNNFSGMPAGVLFSLTSWPNPMPRLI